jgi:hypothetical protein
MQLVYEQLSCAALVCISVHAVCMQAAVVTGCWSFELQLRQYLQQAPHLEVAAGLELC